MTKRKEVLPTKVQSSNFTRFVSENFIAISYEISKSNFGEKYYDKKGKRKGERKQKQLTASRVARRVPCIQNMDALITGKNSSYGSTLAFSSRETQFESRWGRNISLSHFLVGIS